MNKTLKRILIISGSVLLSAAMVVGGFMIAGRKRGKINVYPVMYNAMDSYWGDNMETYGTVRYDRIQPVYLSDTMKVTEVYVTEGQEVTEGTPLLAYDTTLTDIELERKELGITQDELDLKDARSELQRIINMKPYVEPAPTPAPTPKQLHPVPEELLPYVVDMSKGTEEDPYVIICEEPVVYTQSWIEELLKTHEEFIPDDPEPSEDPQPSEDPVPSEDPQPSEDPVPSEDPQPSEDPAPSEDPQPREDPQPSEDPAPSEDPQPSGHTEKKGLKQCWAVFQVREENALDGEVLKQWEITFIREDDGTITFQLYEPDETYLPVEEEEEQQIPADDSSGFTAEEIAQMKKDQLEKIRDLDLKLRMDKVELERMRIEMSTGVITANVDGKIVKATDEETARENNEAIILLSGGGGYIVECSIGEFDRENVHPGDEVTIMSWETGESYMGEVYEVSDTPAENMDGYWGDGNRNISLYVLKVTIREDAQLKEYENVDVTFMNSEEAQNGLYLEVPFIREENGRSYIWVRNDEGRLEKRFVKTGKSVWGSYTQILSGLTMDDYIAFPYGRNLRENAPTREADISELYNG